MTPRVGKIIRAMPKKNFDWSESWSFLFSWLFSHIYFQCLPDYSFFDISYENTREENMIMVKKEVIRCHQ